MPSTTCTCCPDETDGVCWFAMPETSETRERGPVVWEGRVPPAFYDDHVSRGCLAGEVLGRNSTTIRVALDQVEYDDLLSDARYYCDEDTDLPREYRGLVSSAKATVRRLTA